MLRARIREGINKTERANNKMVGPALQKRWRVILNGLHVMGTNGVPGGPRHRVRTVFRGVRVQGRTLVHIYNL